ncbi:nitroreductase [Bradyrhizobium sp. USDA 4369]
MDDVASSSGDSLRHAGRSSMDAIAAMLERRSTRGFADRPVERGMIDEILDAARWAPSGANMQPWQVYVLCGGWKEKVTTAMMAERAATHPPKPDYSYYPDEWFEPYRHRRLSLGSAMYKSLGRYLSPKAREDSWNRNYTFFGAPVALLFFIDRRLNLGSWLDYGMFLQNVMLAARASGLDTCPQASIADYPDAIRRVLGISDHLLLLCGLSLGYADPTQPVNSFERTRLAVSDFTTYRGFADDIPLPPPSADLGEQE